MLPKGVGRLAGMTLLVATLDIACGGEIPFYQHANTADAAGRDGDYKRGYETYIEGFETKGYRGSWEDKHSMEKSEDGVDHYQVGIAAARKEADKGNYKVAFLILQGLLGRTPVTEAEACEQRLTGTKSALSRGELLLAERILWRLRSATFVPSEERDANLKRINLKSACPPRWDEQRHVLGKAILVRARSLMAEKKHEDARVLLTAMVEPEHFSAADVDEARGLLDENALPLLAAAKMPASGGPAEWPALMRIEALCGPLSSATKTARCAPLLTAAASWHVDRASKALEVAQGAILFHLRMAERMGVAHDAQIKTAVAAMDVTPGSNFVVTGRTAKCAGVDAVLQSSLAPLKGPVTVSLDISSLNCEHLSNSWTTGGEQTERYETEMRWVEESHQEERWVRDSKTEFICRNQTVTGCQDVRPKPITEIVTVTEKVARPVTVRKITTAPSEEHHGNSTSVTGPVVVKWTDDEVRVGTKKSTERTITVDGRVKTEGGTNEQHYAAALVRPMALLRLRVAEAMLLERAASALQEGMPLVAEHSYAKLAFNGAITGQRLPLESSAYFTKTYGIPEEELHYLLRGTKPPTPEEKREEVKKEELRKDAPNLLRRIDELNRQKKERN